MKTALYVRVSPIEQSAENQLPELEALASRRGFDIVQTFSENVSAVKTRPEFEKRIARRSPGQVRNAPRLEPRPAPPEHGRQLADRARPGSSRRAGGLLQGAVARHRRAGSELARRDLRVGRRAGAAPDWRPDDLGSTGLVVVAPGSGVLA